MGKLCCETPEMAKELIENEEVSENLSFFFKAFSEAIRIKILLAMLHKEMCVNELAELLNVSQPRVSNQLKVLKYCNLVKMRKEKNNIYYSLDDKHIKHILCTGLEHISHM